MASKLKPPGPKKRPAPKKRTTEKAWRRTVFRAVSDLQKRVQKLEHRERVVTGFSTSLEGIETDPPLELDEMDDFVG